MNLQMKKLTVGDLRKAISELNDNAEVIVFYEGTFEDNPSIFVDKDDDTLVINCDRGRINIR